MEKKMNKRIIFDLPGNITPAETMLDILKSNGLEESRKEYLGKSLKGEETCLAIIRDAALALSSKRIPEKKLAELLAKHLDTSEEIAHKVVSDINQKLTPYAKEITIPKEGQEESTEKPSAQELLIEKIKQGTSDDKNTEHSIQNIEEKETIDKVKKVEIENVDKNAEKLKRQREETAKTGTTSGELQRKNQPDKYRELIE